MSVGKIGNINGFGGVGSVGLVSVGTGNRQPERLAFKVLGGYERMQYERLKTEEPVLLDRSLKTNDINTSIFSQAFKRDHKKNY